MEIELLEEHCNGVGMEYEWTKIADSSCTKVRAF